MDVLIRYGFAIDEIKSMMDSNIYIESIDDENIQQIIRILEKNGCSRYHIKNIFICNPFVFNKDIKDVNKLISLLKNFGFIDLYILFDSNPYILNLDDSDIKKIYDDLKNKGFNNQEIIDYITENVII